MNPPAPQTSAFFMMLSLADRLKLLLEQRLVNIRGECGSLLPRKLSRPRPALLHQLLTFLRIIEPLQRVHVVAGVAPLDNHRGAGGHLLQSPRARRYDRQSGRKRLEHGETEAFV